MTMRSEILGAGDGWMVRSLICTAGPADRPFEEQHGEVCIAAVLQGSFRYRTSTGTALLAPGAVLLGNPGACYQCGHEHGAGDRCLAFHFSPALWSHVVAATPGALRTAFAMPRLPPGAASPARIAAAAAPPRDPAALEALALGFAGAVAAATAAAPTTATLSAADLRRISEAIRRIEAASADPEADLSLAALAAAAGISRYHFLRCFRATIGMPPHQFVLRTRLHRAAELLRRGQADVTGAAMAAGFGDLSTFSRRFRRMFGCAPGAYRRAGLG